MKTTSKEYQEKSATRGQLVRANHRLSDEIRMRGNNDIHDLFVERTKNEEAIKELEDSYFSKLDTVNVSFLIGYRNYYRTVVKIGKTYFDRNEKMTRGNGYRLIEEIEEITEEMTKEMIEDSHYY